MNFKILDRWGNYPRNSKDTVFLTWDDWNDFRFYTLFGIFYIDQNSHKHDLDGINIGFYGQGEGDRVMSVGTEFRKIGDEFFSVGISEQYYAKLNLLHPDTRNEILIGLNDIAKNDFIFQRVKTEQVYYVSFLRSLSPMTITGQFRRMASGGAVLTPFSFAYCYKSPITEDPMLEVDFNVVPESFPPTNVHVIIGRNSSGKTFLINNMMDAILAGDISNSTSSIEVHSEEGDFANVISVSFSAFDDIESRSEDIDKVNGIKYTYIGLKKTEQTNSEDAPVFKSPKELADEFVSHMYLIKSRSLSLRWINSIKSLYSDPNFSALEIHSLMEIADRKGARKIMFERFKDLSSGHKIVLLTITRIIEALQEKTLIVMDEPELRLHPPLLSAFVRAISDLLIELNGVAVIATHSPVVLQEVPRTCVWKLRKPGKVSIAERPLFETFGENVGVLASDVFALEVEKSGYYKMLIDKIEEVGYDYEVLLEHFNGQLGLEARSVALAYINSINTPR
jgi:ABC-type cobalamin/Fe3+-siderophores transport system ATPase subunit